MRVFCAEMPNCTGKGGSEKRDGFCVQNFFARKNFFRFLFFISLVFFFSAARQSNGILFIRFICTAQLNRTEKKSKIDLATKN
jgi:hypothetical protein